jgi:hypothetical protein
LRKNALPLTKHAEQHANMPPKSNIKKCGRDPQSVARSKACAAGNDCSIVALCVPADRKIWYQKEGGRSLGGKTTAERKIVKHNQKAPWKSISDWKWNMF